MAVRIFLYYHFLNPLNSEISRQGSALQQDLHQHKQAAVLYCTVLYCTVLCGPAGQGGGEAPIPCLGQKLGQDGGGEASSDIKFL